MLTGDARARISAATREQVRSAAEALQYVPSHRTRALRLLRSGAVGLIVPDVTNAVFADMLRGVQERARAAVCPYCSAKSTRRRRGMSTYASTSPRAGSTACCCNAVRTSTTPPSPRCSETTPVVLVNSRLPGRRGSVVLDDVAGARLATRHLIELGHEHIAHLAGAVHPDTAARRHQGYLDAMADAGLPVPDSWVERAG